MIESVLAENAILRIIDQKDFDECHKNIKQNVDEYLTKDEFILEISKIDQKFNKILELMINW